MADINIVRRPGPTLRPWLIGLVVLALLIWGIAELVNEDRDNATMAQADSEDGSVAPAVAPVAVAPSATAAATAAPAAEQAPAVTPAPLAALVPLGTQDVGQRVSATGEVLTLPAHGGFWLRTDNQAVIWVRSPQPVRPGQQVQDLPGTIESARPGQPGAALDAGVESSPAGKGLAFAPGLYLDASPTPAPAPAVARARSEIGGAHSGTEARARTKGAKKSGRAG